MSMMLCAVNLYPDVGWSPLLIAYSEERIAVVMALLKHDAVNVHCEMIMQYQLTQLRVVSDCTLMCMIFGCHCVTISLFVHGLCSQDDGRTPLDIALAKNNSAIAAAITAEVSICTYPFGFSTAIVCVPCAVLLSCTLVCCRDRLITAIDGVVVGVGSPRALSCASTASRLLSLPGTIVSATTMVHLRAVTAALAMVLPAVMSSLSCQCYLTTSSSALVVVVA
jgi:hypothetical protein